MSIKKRSNLFIPFDLGVIDNNKDWQESFQWPLNPQENIDLCDGVLSRIANEIKRIENPYAARIAELSTSRAYHFNDAMLHAVCVIDAARKKGIIFRTSVPEVRYLMGEQSLDSLNPEFIDWLFPNVKSRKFDWFRRLLRPRFWTPWWRLLPTLLFPKASAMALSPMMIDWIHKKDIRVDHLDPDWVLSKAMARLNTESIDYEIAKIAADALINALKIPYEVDEDLRVSAKAYVSKMVHICTKRIFEYMTALQDVPDLPFYALNGTGGKLAAGLVASEIMRRGGNVVSFDHITGRGLERNMEYVAMMEMVYCTTFVVATDDAAERLNKLLPEKYLRSERDCRIVGGWGYSSIRDADLFQHTINPKSNRPRVLYVSPMFRGWRSAHPPTTSDPVQLDWELRLIKILKDMPIKLTSRPHPEGVLEGKPHPLSVICRISDRCFEDLIAETDIFLFDWFRTSTLWTALCTNKPIIMIELGYSYLEYFFTDEINDEIKKRITFVRAVTDDRNRLVIDDAELAKAILSAKQNVDPCFFRRILLGEGTNRYSAVS